MSDHRDDDLDLTAAEYVLGTLEPEAARVFQQRLVEDAGARASLSAWERRLAGLGAELTPVAPPESAWQRVAQRTGIANGPADGPSSVASAANDTAVPVGRWRGLAIAASVAAVLLAAALVVGVPGQGTARPTPPGFASMIYDQPTGMSWLITGGDGAGTKLSIEAMGSYDVPSGKTLRLWVKPADGAPRYVGDLPASAGPHAMAINQAARRSIDRDSRFVVSMEDSDHVAADGPSGQIMWVSPIGRRTG